MRASAHVAACIGAAFITSGCGRHALPQHSTLASAEYAFVDVTVIPMDTERSLRHQTVIVRGDRIAVLGPVDAVTVPLGITTIDGRDKFLMPGLADMHAHFYTNAADSTHHTYDRQIATLLVAQGVTTAFVMRGSALVLELRARITNGEMLAPNIVTTGPLLNDSSMTFAQGETAVREGKAAGFDAVKVYTNLSLAGFDGAASAARGMRIPIVGHIPQRVGLFHALNAGQILIAHAEEFLYNPPFHLFYDEPEPERLEPDSIPGVVAAMRRAGAFVTPTLVAYKAILASATDLPALLRDSNVVRFIAPSLMRAMGWLPGQNGRAKRLGGVEQRRRLEHGLAFQRVLIGALQRGGVPLLAGTDIPLPGLVPGIALHQELEELVQSGLTPYQALATATANAARFFQRTGLSAYEDIGTLAAGRRADLVLLDADPLSDIRNTQRIAGVMIRGRWIDRTERNALLATRVGD